MICTLYLQLPIDVSRLACTTDRTVARSLCGRSLPVAAAAAALSAAGERESLSAASDSPDRHASVTARDLDFESARSLPG